MIGKKFKTLNRLYKGIPRGIHIHLSILRGMFFPLGYRIFEEILSRRHFGVTKKDEASAPSFSYA